MTNDRRAMRGSYVDVIDRVSDGAVPAADIPSLTVDVLAQVRQAVCITDAELDEPGPRIQFVNAAYLDLFACEEVEVIGYSPRFAQGPLTDRTVLDRIRAYLEAGQSIRAQAINYRVDGTPFRLRWSIDPIREDDEIVRFVAIMHDVTIEDRMRRRLSALDTLVTAASRDPGETSASLYAAESVGSALLPALAEVGRATVTVGAETVRVGGLAGEFTEPATVLLGHFGTIELEAHHGAGRMLDRVGVEELAVHAGWLFDPGR